METMKTHNNNEDARLTALHDLAILDSNSATYFNALTRLTADLFGLPQAYISLIDNDRQWLKSSIDAGQQSGYSCSARELSFCTYTIQRPEVMVIEDASTDERFKHHPMVTGPSQIRFYAGAPLVTATGHAIGALCITDSQPRQLDEAQRSQLQGLANLAMAHISLRRAVGHIDPVSGLPNQSQLLEDLVVVSSLAAGEERLLAYIDIPDATSASEIAAALGASTFDELVSAVTQQLKFLFSDKANLYHISTTRFAVLSKDTASVELIGCLYSLDQMLHEPLRNIAIPLNLSLHGGIVVFTAGPDAATEAPRKALSAVNQARITQQDWLVYNAQDDQLNQRSFHLLNDVQTAIRDDALYMVYQPKHDLLTGQCHSAEALLRWDHPELGPISPTEFIPLIERTALIRPLTDWVIRTAMRQLRDWNLSSPGMRIAINLSPRNFEEDDLCERLQAACKDFGIDPQWVDIECTEGIWMESGRCLQTLYEIRAMGMGLALDDFGSGYSNFSYLQKVPATVVKLDQSLIRHVHRSEYDQRIVQSLIKLAKELGYKVIAEGVETVEALSLIRSWGCEEAQGYFFAKPMTPLSLKQYRNQYVQRKM